MLSQHENLGLFYRELYRSKFKAAIAAGTARPLVLPFDLVGSFILPALYLCIPHTRRPWLYRMRFAVMALVIYLNLAMIGCTSSANVAVAYGAGLLGGWGIIWTMMLLIWTRPQFEAARVERRPRRPKTVANGNGAVSGAGVETQGKATAPDERVSKVLDEYEYYWQSYPADGSFLTRLDWVTDLLTAFRGSGWNWAISSIPHFQRPVNPHSGELVKLDTIPLVTRSGYTRFRTYSSFLRDRLWRIALSYLALDFCSVSMMKDPYFILGPDGPHRHPLPPHLAALSDPLLQAWRSALSLLGIICAIHLVFSLDQLCRTIPIPVTLGPRADLWHYPSTFGSFANVPRRGLAGFWGAWWHQTFRAAFTAPAAWLARRGLLPRSPANSAAAGLVAFLLSGALHAAGAATAGIVATTTSPSPSSSSLAFFLLSWVGVVAQAAWGAGPAPALLLLLPRGRWRRWVSGAANVAFVGLWLHFTRWALVDDLSRSAIWLFEPVPASPLRALGLGRPGDSWWRWDRDLSPRWYVGRRWWETGITL
ncbi:membrane bound O-acyl transferase family-domain-containing protein [Phialemonium atrogriseum]|uniref:Membrane bound O-acyl transferase family-domain-containing protein n=1 Tax=Phialemonium atrogriseum TaxID=1093897 RepID=A0AAJ0C4F8_9PEZI|nr:membrane bound O-acyl transferase family-domain-containing protein [Phialemonium atrogriseum]KAK1769959.1 membrane bound O-acyl transferase family-domain-containing protein [Phialemonium atrogriseum]